MCMTMKIKCENCGKEFKSDKRKDNHFKICNYANLERQITDLQFELFTMKSNSFNANRKSKNMNDKCIQNINTITNILEDFKEINN